MTDQNIAGYVIVDQPSQDAIWAYGADEVDAWDMLEDEFPDMDADSMEAFQATAELLAKVESFGGSIAFTLQVGIANCWPEDDEEA